MQIVSKYSLHEMSKTCFQVKLYCLIKNLASMLSIVWSLGALRYLWKLITIYERFIVFLYRPVIKRYKIKQNGLK